MDLREIEKKYNIVYIQGKRYYLEDLTVKNYNYENTIPCYFCYEEIEIFNNSWKNMIIELVKALDLKFPKSKEELLSIKADWTKSLIFSDAKKANHVYYKGLYLNCNHTAIHAMWVIQLLLKAYNIPLDKCEFIIKRSPLSESSEVKSIIKLDVLNKFIEYLRVEKSKKSTVIDNIIKCIDFINRNYLPKFSKSYTDLFLIDDKRRLYTIKSNVLEIVRPLKTMDEGKKKTIEYCLTLYINFTKYEEQRKIKEHSSYFRKKGLNFEETIMNLIALDYLS